MGTDIRVRRVYDEPTPEDGVRLLVDRAADTCGKQRRSVRSSIGAANDDARLRPPQACLRKGSALLPGRALWFWKNPGR